jgi:hypothetical protein
MHRIFNDDESEMDRFITAHINQIHQLHGWI